MWQWVGCWFEGSCLLCWPILFHYFLSVPLWFQLFCLVFCVQMFSFHMQGLPICSVCTVLSRAGSCLVMGASQQLVCHEGVKDLKKKKKSSYPTLAAFKPVKSYCNLWVWLPLCQGLPQFLPDRQRRLKSSYLLEKLLISLMRVAEGKENLQWWKIHCSPP